MQLEEAYRKIVASHEPKHHKPWNEYSSQYKRQQEWQIASKMTTALEFTKHTFSPSIEN